jgi:hypothetical protein
LPGIVVNLISEYPKFSENNRMKIRVVNKSKHMVISKYEKAYWEEAEVLNDLNIGAGNFSHKGKK